MQGPGARKVSVNLHSPMLARRSIIVEAQGYIGRRVRGLRSGALTVFIKVRDLQIPSAHLPH
jgi:hypothetical protein